MIPVNRPHIYESDKKLLNQYVNAGWISSESPSIKDFELGLAKRFKRDFAVAVSSGTAALEIAFKIIGIGPGDEVIMPTFTIISCAQAVTKLGGTPVYVDSNIDDFNLKVEDVERLITKKTKAILAVHIYGLPCRIDFLEKIARKYSIFLIEDSAETIGGDLNGQPCGSFGDISIMSFYANKHISTGEGGAILTNSEYFTQQSKYFRNLCFSAERRFLHSDVGWNYRMTGLQAALGLGQLENLEYTLSRKQRIAAIYDELFSEIDSFQLPLKTTEYAENCYWVYPILLDPNSRYDAIDVISILNTRGIESRPFFYPLHLQPVFGLDSKNYNLQNSERLAKYGLYLPSGVGNTDEEIIAAAESLIDILNGV